MERLTVFSARINGGVVEIEQGGECLPADDVLKLVAGVGDSDGFALIGQTLALYFANTQPNTQELIDKLVEVIDETIAICNENGGLAYPVNVK